MILSVFDSLMRNSRSQISFACFKYPEQIAQRPAALGLLGSSRDKYACCKRGILSNLPVRGLKSLVKGEFFASGARASSRA